MDRKAISRAGGKAVASEERAFARDRDPAARTGAKGGRASAAARDAEWRAKFLARRSEPER